MRELTVNAVLVYLKGLLLIKILKFGAQRCAPCRALDNALKGVDEAIISFDVDKTPEVREQYGINNGIPVLIFLYNDIEVYRTIGAYTKREINNIIRDILNGKKNK